MENNFIRFDKYMNAKGLNDNVVTKDLGLSVGLLGKTRKKDNGLSKGLIEKILNFYQDLSPTWLLTGNGSMLKNDTSFTSDTVMYEMPENIIKAPLIGQYANGGYLRGFADSEYLDEQPVFYSTRKHSRGNYVAFEVRGDSMNDGSVRAICEGDILLGMELKKEYWNVNCKLHIPKVFIIVHRTEGITVKEIIEQDIQYVR